MPTRSWTRSASLQGRGLTSPRPLPSAAGSGGLPPAGAQVAIILGFLLGTWLLLNGVLCWITGSYLAVPAGWEQWSPHWASLVFAFGVLWMVVPNLYLFRNRVVTWKAMVVLVVLSSWNLGVVTFFLAAQLVLLLLPTTRRSLRG